MQPIKFIKVHYLEEPPAIHLHNAGRTRFISPGVFTREMDISVTPTTTTTTVTSGDYLTWDMENGNEWTTVTMTTPNTQELIERESVGRDIYEEHLDVVKRQIAERVGRQLMDNGGIELITHNDPMMDTIQITAKLKYIQTNNG